MNKKKRVASVVGGFGRRFGNSPRSLFEALKDYEVTERVYVDEDEANETNESLDEYKERK